jgi:Universal stress protein family
MTTTTAHHLIVWVDGTRESDAALRYATAQALERQDNLILVASIDRPALVLFDVLQLNTDLLLKELRNNVERVWSKPAKSKGLTFQTKVTRGDGAGVLADTARDHQPATIIVGAGSSLASRLVHHLSHIACPLVIVPSLPSENDAKTLNRTID